MARRYETHGLSHTAENNIWAGMIARCHKPYASGYKHYGGRGISVCERWRASLTAFIEDMGMRPTPGHSIDRINNDGNYEPGNCRWATHGEQHENTSRGRHVTIDGKTFPTISAACRHFGISRVAVGTRLWRGWAMEPALKVPVGVEHDATTGRYKPKPHDIREYASNRAGSSTGL